MHSNLYFNMQVNELTKEIEDVCIYIEKSQSGISTILSHNPYVIIFKYFCIDLM